MISDKVVPVCPISIVPPPPPPPAASQEVMQATGSGAVKGKEAANTFRLYEVTASRKETKCAVTWSYECLFIFPLRSGFMGKKGGGGTLQGCPLKHACQAFIVTANIYSNSGIPWM